MNCVLADAEAAICESHRSNALRMKYSVAFEHSCHCAVAVKFHNSVVTRSWTCGVFSTNENVLVSYSCKRLKVDISTPPLT